MQPDDLEIDGQYRNHNQSVGIIRYNPRERLARVVYIQDVIYISKYNAGIMEGLM